MGKNPEAKNFFGTAISPWDLLDRFPPQNLRDWSLALREEITGGNPGISAVGGREEEFVGKVENVLRTLVGFSSEGKGPGIYQLYAAGDLLHALAAISHPSAQQVLVEVHRLPSPDPDRYLQKTAARLIKDQREIFPATWQLLFTGSKEDKDLALSLLRENPQLGISGGEIIPEVGEGLMGVFAKEESFAGRLAVAEAAFLLEEAAGGGFFQTHRGFLREIFTDCLSPKMKEILADLSAEEGQPNPKIVQRVVGDNLAEARRKYFSGEERDLKDKFFPQRAAGEVRALFLPSYPSSEEEERLVGVFSRFRETQSLNAEGEEFEREALELLVEYERKVAQVQIAAQKEIASCLQKELEDWQAERARMEAERRRSAEEETARRRREEEKKREELRQRVAVVRRKAGLTF